MSRNQNSEFGILSHTRVRVAVTVEKNLCDEMKLIHEQETRRAKDEDRVEPDWSNTLEMLLRKGVKAYGKTTSGKINPQEAGQPRPSF